MELIAAGPQDHCEKYLSEWVSQHPLGEFDEALVLEVTVTTTAVERGARVLIEDGRFGVPWEDASEEDRAETMDRVRAILASVTGVK